MRRVVQICAERALANLPKRKGEFVGRATERQMAAKLPADGIRTTHRLNADGSKTTLRTRDGHPIYETTSISEALPEVEFEHVFQAYPMHGSGEVVWESMPDSNPRSWRFGYSPDPDKQWWVSSSKADIAQKMKRGHHRGNIDWFNQSNTSDPENPTVTFSTGRGLGRFSLDKAPSAETPKFHNPDYLPSVYLDGEKILQMGGEWFYYNKRNRKIPIDFASLDGHWVLCAGAVKDPDPSLVSWKWKVVALITDGATIKFVEQTRPDQKSTGTCCHGWNFGAAASYPVGATLLHPPCMNSSATEAAALVLGVVDNQLRVAVYKWSLPSMSQTIELADEYWYTDEPSSDMFPATNISVPGGGLTVDGGCDGSMIYEAAITTPKRLTEYSQMSTVAIQYDFDELKFIKTFGSMRNQVKLPTVAASFPRVKKKIYTLDVQQAYEDNVSLLEEFIWPEHMGGGQLSREQAEAISTNLLSNPEWWVGRLSETQAGYPTGTVSFSCLSPDKSLFRWVGVENAGEWCIDYISMAETFNGRSSGLIIDGVEMKTHHNSAARQGHVVLIKQNLSRVYSLETKSVMVGAPNSPTHGQTFSLTGLKCEYDRSVENMVIGDVDETYESFYPTKYLAGWDARHDVWLVSGASASMSTVGINYGSAPNLPTSTGGLEFPVGSPTTNSSHISTIQSLSGLGSATMFEFYTLTCHQNGINCAFTKTGGMVYNYESPPPLAKATPTSVEYVDISSFSTDAPYTRLASPIFYRKKSKMKVIK